MSEEKVETLGESLRRMDILTVRRFVLEAEAYLAEQVYSSILSSIKVGIGLGLHYDIFPDRERNILKLVSTEVADWKSVGKYISTVGKRMNDAGVNTEIIIENTSDYKNAMFVITLCAFPPPFQFLCEKDDPLSAQEVLEYLETVEDPPQ